MWNLSTFKTVQIHVHVTTQTWWSRWDGSWWVMSSRSILFAFSRLKPLFVSMYNMYVYVFVSISMFWAETWKISEFFIWKFSFFGVKIFSIFEKACFRNVIYTGGSESTHFSHARREFFAWCDRDFIRLLTFTMTLGKCWNILLLGSRFQQILWE